MQLKSQLALAQAHREAFELNAAKSHVIPLEEHGSIVLQKDIHIKELVRSSDGMEVVYIFIHLI